MSPVLCTAQLTRALILLDTPWTITTPQDKACSSWEQLGRKFFAGEVCCLQCHAPLWKCAACAKLHNYALRDATELSLRRRTHFWSCNCIIPILLSHWTVLLLRSTGDSGVFRFTIKDPRVRSPLKDLVAYFILIFFSPIGRVSPCKSRSFNPPDGDLIATSGRACSTSSFSRAW